MKALPNLKHQVVNKCRDLLKVILLASGVTAGDGAPVMAANVYLEPGEGGAGLYAWIEMDERNQLTLAVMGCAKKGDRLRLGLGLFPGKEPRSELRDLQVAEDDAEKDIYLCINEICEKRRWRFASTGFGDVFFTMATIDHRRPIHSIRVRIPNESMKYEYRGDVEGIVRRVCRWQTPELEIKD
jgi:hypothetical protein